MLFQVQPHLGIWENVEFWIFLPSSFSNWGEEMYGYILKGTCWPIRSWCIPNYEIMKVCLRYFGATARAFGVLHGRTIFRHTAVSFLRPNPIPKEKIVLPVLCLRQIKGVLLQVQGWVGTGSGQKLVCLWWVLSFGFPIVQSRSWLLLGPVSASWLPTQPEFPVSLRFVLLLTPERMGQSC